MGASLGVCARVCLGWGGQWHLFLMPWSRRLHRFHTCTAAVQIRLHTGFLMRRAFELAFSTAYLFAGRRPGFVRVDEVTFRCGGGGGASCGCVVRLSGLRGRPRRAVTDMLLLTALLLTLQEAG
jgi:hypothetical protein